MIRIRLTKNKYTLVNDEDFEKVNQFKWYADYQHGYWYAIRNIRKSNNKRRNEIDRP